MPALLRDLIDGIIAQPVRFALSFLSITIGVIALALLIIVLTALQQRSQRLVDELGANVIAIVSEPASGRETGRLTVAHAELISQNFPDLLLSTVRRDHVNTLGSQEKLAVIGTDSQLPIIRDWALYRGRFLDHHDLLRQERHIVISRSLSQLWNWQIGQTVLLQEMPFNIVGIVQLNGTAGDREYGDQRITLGERVVFIPRTVVPYWSKSVTLDHRDVDAIFIRDRHGLRYQSFLPSLQNLVAQPDQNTGRVSWITPETLLAKLSKFQNTIGITVGTVAILCLVLGGTTLMSLMIANIRDRVGEIGLRRAFGARPYDIALLFVAEACLVTLAAGLVGTLSAHALLLFLGDWLPFPLHANGLSLFVPTAVASALGIVFSYWPARIAARIEPADALRSE